MYRGFNLQLHAPFYLDAGLTDGIELNNKNRKYVRETLADFISPTGIVDGSKLRENWFLLLEAEVFINGRGKVFFLWADIERLWKERQLPNTGPSRLSL